MRPRRAPRGSAHRQQQRLVVVAVLAVLGYVALAARAVQLHAVDAEWLAARAAAQHDRTLRLEALRGEIRDRRGKLLAVSADVESVAISPARVADPRRVARALAPVLRIPARDLERKIARGRGFLWAKRWVTPDEAERVRRLRLEGVSLHPERKRFYPNRSLAAALIGFAGHDGTGLAGIELGFDAALRGAPLAMPAARDARGQILLPWEPRPEARLGARLVLTLDARLQHFSEQALDRALARTGARQATLVALDPRTGDLLALAERPAFDPNLFWKQAPSSHRSRAFVDSFEPGSTLKPFVVATALEAGAVRPSDRFDCENGAWRVRDRVIRDFRPHGVLSVADVVRVSSNIGTAKIADRLGSRALVAGLRRFGFGERTGSGFPGEAPGVLHDLRERQAVERANLAFGQGISVTAVQLATAAAAFANGGHRVRPRLALRLERGERTVEWPSAPAEPVLSAATARTVRDMLREAVAHGSGRAAALPHVSVAGKTGTAQKVVNGSYSEEDYVAAFVGMVPADAPRLVVAVVLDEPRGVHTGGAVAAPVFREVAGYAVEQLALPGEGAE
jgi:cell division protein FtsI (penicillin-binding protein 3)